MPGHSKGSINISCHYYNCPYESLFLSYFVFFMNTTQVALTYFLAVLYKILVYSSFLFPDQVISGQGLCPIVFLCTSIRPEQCLMQNRNFGKNYFFFLLVDIKLNRFLIVATLANF